MLAAKHIDELKKMQRSQREAASLSGVWKKERICCRSCWITGWWFQILFYGDMISIDSYFSDRLKPPIDFKHLALDSTPNILLEILISRNVGFGRVGFDDFLENWWPANRKMCVDLKRKVGSKLLSYTIHFSRVYFMIWWPIGSMYDICTYIWLIFMVNVGKYTTHGSYGWSDDVHVTCKYRRQGRNISGKTWHKGSKQRKLNWLGSSKRLGNQG